MSSPPLSLRPEVLAFLADIKEHPGDDTPRLILADWLQDQGDPRGEFIRLQCLQARRPADLAQQPLDDRLDQLRREHRDAWLGPLVDMALDVWFERGLLRLHVESTAVTGGDLDAVAETTAWHWVEGVKVRLTGPQDAAALARSPSLRHVLAL